MLSIFRRILWSCSSIHPPFHLSSFRTNELSRSLLTCFMLWERCCNLVRALCSVLLLCYYLSARSGYFAPCFLFDHATLLHAFCSVLPLFSLLWARSCYFAPYFLLGSATLLSALCSLMLLCSLLCARYSYFSPCLLLLCSLLFARFCYFDPFFMIGATTFSLLCAWYCYFPPCFVLGALFSILFSLFFSTLLLLCCVLYLRSRLCSGFNKYTTRFWLWNYNVHLVNFLLKNLNLAETGSFWSNLLKLKPFFHQKTHLCRVNISE